MVKDCTMFRDLGGICTILKAHFQAILSNTDEEEEYFLVHYYLRPGDVCRTPKQELI